MSQQPSLWRKMRDAHPIFFVLYPAIIAVWLFVVVTIAINANKGVS